MLCPVHVSLFGLGGGGDDFTFNEPASQKDDLYTLKSCFYD